MQGGKKETPWNHEDEVEGKVHLLTGCNAIFFPNNYIGKGKDPRSSNFRAHHFTKWTASYLVLG
jgi:hypothetical protein